MFLKDNWDLFLLERGRFVSVRVNGQDCGADKARLAQAFPALNLSGKNCLAFEPALFRFEDDVSGLEIHAANVDDFYREIVTAGVDGMVDTLNNLLNEFDRIKAEVENPYYGMTAEDIDRTQTITALAATDAGMGRVVEDLITALVAKGLIAPADLPQAAQDRLTARQALRGALK